MSVHLCDADVEAGVARRRDAESAVQRQTPASGILSHRGDRDLRVEPLERLHMAGLRQRARIHLRRTAIRRESQPSVSRLGQGEVEPLEIAGGEAPEHDATRVDP